MKKCASLLLAVLMLAAAAPAQVEPIPVQPVPAQNAYLCDAMLVIGITAAATYFVIWAMNGTKKNCCIGPAELVLLQDHYDGVWVPVATNVIPVLCTTNKFDVFRGQLGGEGTRYRVKVTPLPQ